MMDYLYKVITILSDHLLMITTKYIHIDQPLWCWLSYVGLLQVNIDLNISLLTVHNSGAIDRDSNNFNTSIDEKTHKCYNLTNTVLLFFMSWDDCFNLDEINITLKRINKLVYKWILRQTEPPSSASNTVFLSA